MATVLQPLFQVDCLSLLYLFHYYQLTVYPQVLLFLIGYHLLMVYLQALLFLTDYHLLTAYLQVLLCLTDYDLLMAFVCSLIIAAVTFVICVAGCRIGKTFGTRLAGKSQILGGCILIVIGLEIFIRGVFL